MPASNRAGAAGDAAVPAVSALRKAVALAIALAAGLHPAFAAAETSVPVIVTYELARQRDAERLAARDPRAFWIRQIVTRIEERKTEPPMALKSAVTVQVGFTVARDGRLLAKSLKATSGLPAVDAAAMTIIERAAPFAPMPAALADKDMSFVLPLRFK